jgi:hypothetical protein
MRNLNLLGALFLVACVTSAVAADKQVVAQNDVVVAKKAKAPAAHAAAVKPVSKARGYVEDSRINDYALERESCCGPN